MIWKMFHHLVNNTQEVTTLGGIHFLISAYKILVFDSFDTPDLLLTCGRQTTCRSVENSIFECHSWVVGV